jgi:hypothetical protein
MLATVENDLAIGLRRVIPVVGLDLLPERDNPITYVS